MLGLATSLKRDSITGVARLLLAPSPSTRFHLLQSLCEMCPNTTFFLGRIQSECGKIRTRKNSYLDTFHAVAITSTN